MLLDLEKQNIGNTAIIIRNQGPKGSPGMPELLKPFCLIDILENGL